MNILQRIWVSSLGRKYIMALTGAALFLFAVGHMVGNLQVFLGPEAINRYGHFLKSTPELLWPARLGLLACVGMHVAAAMSLSAQNKQARPQRYAGGDGYGAEGASRLMLGTGVVIAAFVVYHLLHYTLTLPAVNGYNLDFSTIREAGTGHHDIFAMIILGFQKWPVSLFYIVAVGLLCTHLSHGISAMFQSLGLRNHTWWPRITVLARVASVVLFLGYASIPLSVLMGYGSAHVQSIRLKATSPAPAAAPASHSSPSPSK